MATGLDPREVELMPVPSLRDRLLSIRRVDARRRIRELNERSIATRGTEEAVTALRSALAAEAGATGARPARGGVSALKKWLAGPPPFQAAP